MTTTPHVNIPQRRVLILSTAHLRKETAEAHNAYREEGFLWPVPYGYICWAWEPEDCPTDLAEIIRHLRANCQIVAGDYIRFDCDEPPTPGLTTYSW